MCVTPEIPVWVNARGILSEKMRDQEGVVFLCVLCLPSPLVVQEFRIQAHWWLACR